MKYLSYIIIAVFGISSLSGQNVGDAVRFANYSSFGSAGSLGLGSSIGAIGGDYSVIGINPAGIAEFRKSVFTFTPSLNTQSSDAYFNGSDVTASRSRSSFLVDNISLVSSSSGKGEWSTSNWAVGLNKIAEFNRDVKIEGATEGSITERFVALANSFGLDEFEAGVAEEAQAIFLNQDDVFQSDFFDDDIVNKDVFLNQRGSINELSIGWAGNYDNKLNLGISAGVPFVSFSETKTYKENFQDGDFSSDLEYVESLNTTGTGINFKLGLQYRAVRQLRIGAAIHSPTWYTLNDDFTSTASYDFSSVAESGGGDAQSPDGSFRYGYSSPWKAVGSIASVYKFGKFKGFINADFEYLDYRNTEFDFTRFSSGAGEAAFTQEINGDIDEELGSSTNIRLGTELAYESVRFRVGYGINSSPYVNEDEVFTSWSAGVGFRATSFFIDIGYRRSNTSEGYNTYTVPDAPERNSLALVDTDFGKVAATIGFLF